MRKYRTNLNNMITLREKEELIKTESFGSQKYDVDNFAMHGKFRYHSEISTYSENFAMHRKFRYIAKFLYHSEISLCSEISTYNENFAMIAKISLSLRNFRYDYEIASLLLLASWFL